MTVTASVVERSGPAVRAALAKHAPQDCARFEAELREALTRAGDDLDVTRVDAVLARWHARAMVAANPLTAEELVLVQRAKAGDFAGLRSRDELGVWTTL